MINKMLLKGVMALALGLCSVVHANICIELPNLPTGDFIFEDNLMIASHDNTEIAANLFTPKTAKPEQGYPAIIFINSWTLGEHQYIWQAKQFADKGYLVLSYSARGWGCSGGQVNAAGQKDIMDLSSVIDWLGANTQVDMNNIGVSGISYGSGISLMGLAQEPRIKTAVAMSTWGSLTDSMYHQESARLFWGFFLVTSGYITANLDPKIASGYLSLITGQNIEQTFEWMKQRSVSEMINLINERNAPVYIANNFGDNLFQPNGVMDLYQMLTVPKRLDLNQGSHASAEGFGLVGLDSFTWQNTHRWFDHWLKNESTGIMADAPVTMEVSTHKTRESFTNWPIAEKQEVQFYMQPKSMMSAGQLSESPFGDWLPRSNRIYSGMDTMASSGIPLVSEILEAHLQRPITTPLNMINPMNGIYFQSEPLSDVMKIRGIPELSVALRSTSSKFQLTAYLYDVDEEGVGTLITHGPITRRDGVMNRTMEIDWQMVATAYDVPAGHRIAVAFDTFDVLYAPPTLIPYAVDFRFQRSIESVLSLPTVQ